MIETAREALVDLEEYLSGAWGRRAARTRTLSDGEREVLALLAEGLTTGEVAEALSLSEHAIRSRIKTTLAKLGARNREHAVAIAIREGAV